MSDPPAPIPPEQRARTARHIALMGVILLAAFGVWVFRLGLAILPDRYEPWTELSLNDPLGPFTEFKLASYLGDTQSCQAALEEAGVQFTPVEPRRTESGCGYSDGIRIVQASAAYSAPQPIITRCALAAGLNLWERQVLAPAAEARFGEGVAEILHFGTYACRNVNHASSGRLSQHAHANAIDISGVRLDSGRVISVREGWEGEADERAFLRDIRDGGCAIFRGVISPDADAAHHDHFHFDMGRWDFCR